jgi:hypothetical protein
MSIQATTTFGAYLRAWWKAAFAPAWDAFGWLGLAFGAVLWAWHRFRPGSFGTVVRYFGFTPDAALSDLVWIVPLLLGAAVLLFRLIRAPFEMYIALEKRVATLSDVFPFAVSVPETFATNKSIQLRVLILNRQPNSRLALGLALCMKYRAEETQHWHSQAELRGIQLNIGPQEMTDGVVVFSADNHDPADIESISLGVFDMVSQRATPLMSLPGSYPPELRLRPTNQSTFTKGPDDVGVATLGW